MKGRYRYETRKTEVVNSIIIVQSAILRSGYTVNQTWKGLKKAWLGYTIAKNKGEDDRMVYYAERDSEITK